MDTAALVLTRRSHFGRHLTSPAPAPRHSTCTPLKPCACVRQVWVEGLMAVVLMSVPPLPTGQTHGNRQPLQGCKRNRPISGKPHTAAISMKQAWLQVPAPITCAGLHKLTAPAKHLAVPARLVGLWDFGPVKIQSCLRSTASD
ncbi:hypothetical protein HaLaN_00787, partial [Haematococcus lacustris]